MTKPAVNPAAAEPPAMRAAPPAAAVAQRRDAMEIILRGHRLSVSCPEAERETMRAAVAEVSRLVERLREKVTADTERAALMAAVQIAFAARRKQSGEGEGVVVGQGEEKMTAAEIRATIAQIQERAKGALDGSPPAGPGGA
jgi:cell division protein ZapA (FtsZ GTPase activity inhibitor)